MTFAGKFAIGESGVYIFDNVRNMTVEAKMSEIIFDSTNGYSTEFLLEGNHYWFPTKGLVFSFKPDPLEKYFVAENFHHGFHFSLIGFSVQTTMVFDSDQVVGNAFYGFFSRRELFEDEYQGDVLNLYNIRFPDILFKPRQLENHMRSSGNSGTWGAGNNPT